MDGSLPAGKLLAGRLCFSTLLLFRCNLWKWTVSHSDSLKSIYSLKLSTFWGKVKIYPIELHWQRLNVTYIFFCDYVLLPLLPSRGNLQGMVLKNRKIHK